MDRRLLEPAATRLRQHPVRVDLALACLLAVVTTGLQAAAGLYSDRSPFALLLGLVLCLALVWRRSRPLLTAGIVAAACLVELVVLPYDFLLANVAAPMTVHALAAYGPRWAGRAGLLTGLVGALLFSGVYYDSGQVDGFATASATVGGVVVASWALGVQRRARLHAERAGVTDAPRRPLLQRMEGWLRRHPFGVDATLAGLAVLVLVVVSSGDQPDGELSAVVGLALLVPLAWRRRRPVRAAAVVVVGCLAELVLLPGQFLPANVAAPAMVYALAAYAPRWAGRAGLATGLVGAVLASVTYFGGAGLFSYVATAGAIGVLVIAAWALGDLRRARLEQVAGLEERARLLELEREQEMQLAASTERARIAREMHDVVAHSLSVVIAQADGGRYAGQADPAAATSALEQISSTGRQALAEMRKLLGVLREGDGQEFAPQPDVAAIDRLVADVRSSGLDVELVVEGRPQPMPAGPQLAAYRIVQESLTNVLKHAGPAGRAEVRLQWRPDALELSVTDDGRGAAAAIVESDGQGQGLLGMRERAQLHGGRLTAGPRDGGGFGVRAVLPYRSAR
ncbi:sensor histidine kinase [Modestobacter sp. SSW1-42]|uniref:sensor histidine kinase n=1 Tax=Modestobacter sp. SSW1-42 TaxID=596372 RepID=UPI003986A2E1